MVFELGTRLPSLLILFLSSSSADSSLVSLAVIVFITASCFSPTPVYGYLYFLEINAPSLFRKELTNCKDLNQLDAGGQRGQITSSHTTT